MSKIQKEVFENVSNRLKSQGTDISEKDLLDIIDGYFRGMVHLHQEKQDVRLPYIATSIFDPEKEPRKEYIIEESKKEIKKIIEEKGIISKQEVRDVNRKVALQFTHIKPLT